MYVSWMKKEGERTLEALVNNYFLNYIVINCFVNACIS